MKKVLFLTVVLLFSCVVSVFADKECVDADPLKRNLIFAEGNAEIVIPISNFEIRFGFDVQKGSFDEASRESNQIFDKIEKEVKGLGLSDIEVIRGWDVLRQAKISIGAKGKKISTKVAIKVMNCPKGELHSVIAQVIDKALAIDSAIVLENIKVFISEEIEQQKKQEVIEKAIKELNANAIRMATALGKTIVAPKRVYAASENIEKMDFEKLYFEESLSGKLFDVRKSFKVEAEIVDHVKISATVAGVYQID
ncbi:MAG: SIMPL domain-containing protein [Candidatus Omnitrophota bacterium]